MIEWLESLNPFVLVAYGTVVILAVCAILGYIFGAFWGGERDARDQELEYVAAQLGLKYSVANLIPLHMHLTLSEDVPLEALGDGVDRNRLDRYPPMGKLLHGQVNGLNVIGFDTGTYLTGESDEFAICPGGMSALLAIRGTELPHLAIRPKRLTDAMLGKLDAHAVDFSHHAEFDDGFFVGCRDQAFARKVIGPGMIEFLLGRHGWFIELRRRDVLIYDCEVWSAHRFREALEVLLGFIEHLPESLASERTRNGQAAGRVQGL